MAYDYYTVWALADELKGALVGAEIYAANTRGPVLFLQSDRGAILVECRREGTLRFLVGNGKANTVAQGDGPERYFAGARIVGIAVSGRDRVISFVLERVNQRQERSYGTLNVELLNNRLACALTSNRSGEILGAWGGQDRIKVGQVYVPPSGEDRLLPGVDRADVFIEKALSENIVKLGDACRRFLVGLDRQQMAELFFRAALTPEVKLDKVSLQALWGAGEEMLDEAQDGNGYAYRIDLRWHFSALKPQRLGSVSPVEKGAISEVAGFATRENSQLDRAQRRQDGIRQIIRRELKSCRKKISAMKDDLAVAEKGPDWKRKGHILLAQVDAVPTGCKHVELLDVFDPDGLQRCSIELNPNLSAAENAAFMLKKAQKYQRREQMLPRRIEREESLEKELGLWAERLEKEGNSAKEIEGWLEKKGFNQKNTGEKLSGKEGRQYGQGAHPRQYCTTDGWTVLAGRNNKENDILTHRIAAQNDVWFHAHGYPGSHVLLRRDGRKEEPSKQSLEQAAAVAAFWSKGKSAKKVPVVYTLAKYVSKPKGAAPGQAVMKREKTIIVEPQVLPAVNQAHN